MTPPNIPDTIHLDTQLDAMAAQLTVLSFVPETVTSTLTDRFPFLETSVFKTLAQTLHSHSDSGKLSGLVESDLSGLIENDLSDKLSHHIKFRDKPPLKYCDVIYDRKTKQCTLLLKMQESKNHEGSFKRATKQIAIQIDPDKGLRFCPVVSLKGVNNSYEKIDSTNRDLYKTQNETAIREATQEGALAFTCISGSDPQGNSLSTKFNRHLENRAIQIDYGITVEEAMEAVKNRAQKKEDELLSNLCHYVKQIGFQLDKMHQNDHTHFDVKLANILVQPSELTRDGHTTTIPVFTLIDIPNKKTNPNTIQKQSDLLYRTTYTPLYSPTWLWNLNYRRNCLENDLSKLGLDQDKLNKFMSSNSTVRNTNNLCGHMFDSYAFLLGFAEQTSIDGFNTDQIKPFKDFFNVQMDLYLNAAIDITNGKSSEWPENLTVSGITKSFTRMINNTCKDKNFLIEALENADAHNQIPSQPFNQTGNLPEYQATTLPIENLLTPSSLAGDPEATAEIKNLKTAFEKLRTHPHLHNIQIHIQIELWKKVLDFITSLFSKNFMTRQQAKNILVDFCNKKNVDVEPVIQALTLIEEKKMVKDEPVLLSVAAVKMYLKDQQKLQNPSVTKQAAHVSHNVLDNKRHHYTENIGLEGLLASTQTRCDALHNLGEPKCDNASFHPEKNSKKKP